MMRTTAEADNFNLASVLNVISKMIRCVKKMLPAAVVVCLAAGRLAAQPAAGLNGLPLFFEAGPGRPADPPQFLARTRDGQVTISPAGVDLALRPEAAVAMRSVSRSELPAASWSMDRASAEKMSLVEPTRARRART